MKRSQSGFTLIELIVVIVVLGILAATVVPRFTRVQAEARIGVLQGLEASIRSAASMYHGVKLAQGTAAGAVVASTSFEGVGADVPDVNFYPSAVATGIAALVDGGTAFGAPTCAAGVCTWTHASAPTPANCSITYTDAILNNPPAISVPVTNGC